MQTTVEGQVWLQRVCRLNFCEMFEASSNLELCARAWEILRCPDLHAGSHAALTCLQNAESQRSVTLLIHLKGINAAGRGVHGALYMTFGTTGCRTRTQVWQPHLLPSFSFMFSDVVKHRRDKGSYLFVLRPGKQARGCCGRLSFQI